MNNGVTEPTLMHRPLAAVETMVKIRTWGEAFKGCRIVAGFDTPTKFLTVAKQEPAGRDLTKGKLARYEGDYEKPSPAHAELFRRLLPKLIEYDKELPPYLRAEPKRKRPDVKPSEGWSGPRVTDFFAALKYVREKAGDGQRDVALYLGVSQSTYCRYEGQKSGSDGDKPRIIQEVYDRLCERYPMLAYGPKPEFSVKYANQFKTDNYIKAKELLHTDAREKRNIELALEKHKQEQEAPAVDMSTTNMHGANYGTLKAKKIGLEMKLAKMKEENKRAEERILGEIADLDPQIAAAEAEMIAEAARAHEVDV